MVRTGTDLVVAIFLLPCFLVETGGVSKMEVCCCRDVRILFDLLSSGGVTGWAAAAASRFLVDLLELLRAGDDEETEDWGSS